MIVLRVEMYTMTLLCWGGSTMIVLIVEMYTMTLLCWGGSTMIVLTVEMVMNSVLHDVLAHTDKSFYVFNEF